MKYKKHLQNKMRAAVVVFSFLVGVVNGVREVSFTLDGVGEPTNTQLGAGLTSNSDTAFIKKLGTYGNANAQMQVYKRNPIDPLDWVFVKSLTETDSDATGNIGASKLMANEDYFVLANSFFDGGATTSGKLHVYGRNVGGTDNWGYVKSIVQSTPAASDRLGGSVTVIEGNTLVSCSSSADTSKGKCWVFYKDQGGIDNWGQVTVITATPYEAQEFALFSVKLIGDELWVGAGGAQPTGQSTSQAWGAVYVFGRNQGGADNWGQVRRIGGDEINAGTPGFLNSGDYAFRRFDITPDGNTLIFSMMDDSLFSNNGKLVILGKDVGGTDNWGVVGSLFSENPAASVQWGSKKNEISPDGSILAVSYIVSGAEKIEIRGKDVGGSNTWGFVETLDFSDSPTDNFGIDFDFSGSTIVAPSNFWDDPSGNADVGRVQFIDIPPCAFSSECDTGSFCAASLKCEQVSCSAHSDCIADFLPGRLPHCSATSGLCEDIYAGTCTDALSCNVAVGKKVALKKSIGAMSQTLTGTNTTAAREAIVKLTTDVLATTTVNISTFIEVVETVTLDNGIFDLVNDDAAVLAHIKTLVANGFDEGAFSVAKNARRVLIRDLAGATIVTVTYEIDPTTFAALDASGSFTDPSFATALGNATGFPGQVTVSSATGEFTVTYTVQDEPVGSDPLTDEALLAIAQLESDIVAVTATVISELGLQPGDLSSAVVDKCAGRDCNGHGTCDPLTGACACTDSNYWGINCETLVDCGTGTNGPVDGVAYCVCDYPKHGTRCDNTKDCSTC